MHRMVIPVKLMFWLVDVILNNPVHDSYVITFKGSLQLIDCMMCLSFHGRQVVHMSYSKCLLSVCLQVLHMDRNDYYGGESSSLNLIQVPYARSEGKLLAIPVIKTFLKP